MAELRGSGRSRKALSAPVPLTADHDVAGFDCGVPALNHWLTQRALKNESRFSRTYVVPSGKRVIAYFCISAGSIERAAAPGKLRRNATEGLPVSIIGRLAVDRSHAGRGLGADILADALRRIAVASQSIGIRAVLVQAKDEDARRFYTACAEFLEYPAESRTLFLPIDRVVAAFS
jgi:GNAT superfamily N-acetyltransferase